MILYIFIFCMILGLFIQIFKTFKINKIYSEFIELQKELNIFSNAISSENKDINNISQSVQNLSFMLPFYDFNNMKEAFILLNNYKVNCLDYLLQNYIDIIYDNFLEFEIKNYFKILNTVFISISYNISFYETKAKYYFYNIFNPLIFLGNSINLILFLLFKNIDLKFPSFLEKMISILSSIATLVQFYFFVKGLH